MTSNEAQPQDCSLCSIGSGETDPPRPLVLRNELVTAYISGSASEVPGWCQLQVNRHAATLADLTDAEAAAIGVASRDLAAAGLVTTGGEMSKVYMYSMCEFVPHFHLVIGLAPATEPDQPRGAPLLSRVLGADQTLRDAAYADSIAAKMRAALATER